MTDERRVEVASEAPRWADLYGADPNFTLGMDASRYLTHQRGECPDDVPCALCLLERATAVLDAHDGDLRAELNNLRRWKREALEVAAAWEQVWVELGQPGPLGASKAEASRVAVDALRRQYEADLDRVTYLRASAAVAERDEARAALARVEALHQPHTTTGGLTYCTAFRCCDPSGIPSEWPCDTRRAITGEEPSS